MTSSITSAERAANLYKLLTEILPLPGNPAVFNCSVCAAYPDGLAHCHFDSGRAWIRHMWTAHQLMLVNAAKFESIDGTGASVLLHNCTDGLETCVRSGCDHPIEGGFTGLEKHLLERHHLQRTPEVAFFSFKTFVIVYLCYN